MSVRFLWIWLALLSGSAGAETTSLSPAFNGGTISRYTTFVRPAGLPIGSNDNVGAIQNLGTTLDAVPGVAAFRYLDADGNERGAVGYGSLVTASSPTYRTMFIEIGDLLAAPDALGTSFILQNTHGASSTVLPGNSYTAFRLDETGYFQFASPTGGNKLVVNTDGSVSVGGLGLAPAAPSAFMVNGGVAIGSQAGVTAVASGNLNMSGTFSQATTSTTYKGNVVGRWRFEETGNGDTIQTNSAMGVIGSGTTHSLTYQSHLGGVTAIGNDGTNGILATGTASMQFRTGMTAGTGDPTTGTVQLTLSTGGAAVTGGITSSGLISGGTKFTISGCAAGTTVGGSAAGTFLSGTTGPCTVVITLNGATGLTAPNGWTCSANDLTTPANLISQSASSTTTCTVTGTTVSGDKIAFQAQAF